MCIEEEQMTNSQVLQFIIKELSRNNLGWNTDKELFELMCHPIPFGQDRFQKRKEAKNKIIELFKKYDSFDHKRFKKYADNIICGDSEESYRKEILSFLYEEIARLQIDIDADLALLVENIPCKEEGEKNYKTHFSNWRIGKTNRINSQKIKQQLQQNFHFPPSLWESGDATIKATIREGVQKFIQDKFEPQKPVLDNINNDFGMNTHINESEKSLIPQIEQMKEEEVMAFIAQNHPLQVNFSQEFIKHMVLILYEKGYYTLLLNDIIPSLDIRVQNTKEIAILKAHIYSSPAIREYRKAYDILYELYKNMNLEHNNDVDKEIIDLQTETVSNLRRHKLLYANLTKDEKKETIEKLVNYYQNIFEQNDLYHYYPAINLVYMNILYSLLNDDENINQQINSIYNKTKHSINQEKMSDDPKERYYANITDLEFTLLQGISTPIARLEKYLETEATNIPLTELARTQRQMLFFIDTIKSLYGTHTPILIRIENATEIIDDFLEYHEEL